MKRVMMQVYASDAAAAIDLYKRAFDARLLEIHYTPEGGVFHSELDVDGQILSVTDRDAVDGPTDITGNVMQYCLHFDQGMEAFVSKAYEALRENGVVRFPLGPCVFSPCMTDIVDGFGVRWCLFTA